MVKLRRSARNTFEKSKTEIQSMVQNFAVEFQYEVEADAVNLMEMKPATASDQSHQVMKIMLSPLLFLCVLVIISTVFGDTSVKITQFPECLTANRRTNITFYCGYPFSVHSSRIQVYWRKQGETTYLHTQEDSRKRFGVKSKGNRFFQFLDVNIQDAAVYHCELVLEGKKVGKGNGSRLIVYVPPTPLAISRMDPERNLSVFLTLVCETAEFFPENLNLTWYKNGIEITTVNTITEQRNPGQLFKAQSYLEETQPVQSGDVYTCLVSHVSLQNPGLPTIRFCFLTQVGRQQS
eukprot:gi/632972926/ref/XP_007902898.1/ PREDICTED: uncharacterized protein LOC103185943 [Callorhinchus milii]